MPQKCLRYLNVVKIEVQQGQGCMPKNNSVTDNDMNNIKQFNNRKIRKYGKIRIASLIMT